MLEETLTIHKEWLVHVDILPSDLATIEPTYLPADRTPALVYLAGLSTGSRATMHNGLAIVVALLTMRQGSAGFSPTNFPWWLLRFSHINAVRAILDETRPPATANRVLSALRGVLKICRRLRLMSSEDCLDATDFKLLKNPRPDEPAGRAVLSGETQALLGVCAADPSPAGPRDAAIIGLGVFAGLRRSEIAHAQFHNWDPDQQTLKIVRSKGNKSRTVPLAAGLAAALSDWMHLRGDAAGSLFLAINKGGHIQQDGLSGQAIAKMMDKRRIEAGVKDFSPHDLRRTFASDLLDAGADIVTVQKLMGHSDVSTTAIYDRRGAATRRNAVNRLHMPWTRRY